MSIAWSVPERCYPRARTRSSEHAAVLQDASRFDTLHRKDDFFDVGIITIFGVKHGIAELQSFRFRPSSFTPATAKQWLTERGFMPLLFVEGDAA